MNRSWILVLFLVSGAFAARAEETAGEEPERPHFSLFGFTIYADEIDANLGEARGHVVVDGSTANKLNSKFPVLVEAELLKVNLAGQSVLLSGWPKLSWPGASLKATSEETTVKLSQKNYAVEGPAAYSLNLGELKKVIE